MNGFDEKRGLDDDNFGASGSIVSAFDAFRTFEPILLSMIVPRDSPANRPQPSRNPNMSPAPLAAASGPSP